MKISKLYDSIIIGAGPAGLTAALYCRRAGLRVLVLEKGICGGKLNKTLRIENYPGYREINGPKLGEYMTEQIQELDVEVITGEVIAVEKGRKWWQVICSDGAKYRGKTILIAAGMRERTLDIPNVHEYYGNGVSYCAICDGNLYKDRNVIVVGGGNSAVEESLYLSDVTGGVNLIHRRREYRAEKIFVERMKKNGKIRENTPYVPLSVQIENGRVIGLMVKNTETEVEKTIEGDCVFFYIGLIPEIGFLKNLDLRLDEHGFIWVNSSMETSLEGVYAAGDVIGKDLRQVVTAVNDGAIAAISIKNYLNNLSD